MKLIIALIASALAIWGNVPYLKKTLSGKVKPHAYTWFVWSIISLVTFFGQLQKGGGVGVIPTFTSEIFTVIIFLFSLKYGFTEKSRSDKIFLYICLLGLIPWVLTKYPTISVVTVVLVDCVAFLPSYRKAYSHPQTEDKMLYLMNVLRHILMLAAMQSYNIATTFHSIAMISTNSIMTGILVFQNSKKNLKQQHK